MKLTEFKNTKNTMATRVLKETYDLPFNLKGMSLATASAMLRKVRNLINESKNTTSFYKNQTSPAYMKLVFMEQALSQYSAELKNRPTRIVIENEEVDKSQVVLAAQDMVDSIQKMIEEVSDMIVKELPALVDSIQSEIGANESQQFNSQAGESLTSLQAALTQSQTSMKSALDTITGQGGAVDFTAASDDVDTELPNGEENTELDVTDIEEPDFSEEEPESMPIGGVGREKR